MSVWPIAIHTGILQVDRYAGFNELFKDGWSGQPMTRANCWAHGRREFFKLVDVASQLKRRNGKKPVISPIAMDALERIDRIFDIEREINGKTADERLAARQERVAPLVGELETWMREQRAQLSRHDAVAKAINYFFNDWPGFTNFLSDGRICLTNNCAERQVRGIAPGQKSMALRRLRPRWRTGRNALQPHPDLPPQ